MTRPGKGGLRWWLVAWLASASMACACAGPGATQIPDSDASVSDGDVPDGVQDAGVPDGVQDAGVSDGVQDAGVSDGELDGGAHDGGLDPVAPDAGPEPDLRLQLESLPGVVGIQEIPTQTPGYRYFVLRFEQPLDHGRSDRGQFEQQVTLMHVDTAAPMVLETSGYRNEGGDWLSEPADLLGANQLVVEHRFFGLSRPEVEPTPWDLLDVDQAARDVHRVIESFATLYRQPWVSTGISKGGMAALFHRQRFPEDVAGTIAYVAPISLGLPDQRYVDFFDQVGTPTCRERLRSLQREILLRRPAIIETARFWAGALRFDIMGGLERAFEASVAELQWSFWQNHGHRADACQRLPSLQATDESMVFFMIDLDLLAYYSDPILLPLQPYYHQVAAELGEPAAPLEHLADLLQFDHASLLDLLLPPDVDPTYDPTAMQEAREWVRNDARAIQLIYGGNDPWTSGRVGIDAAAATRDVHELIAPGQDHGVEISLLAPADAQDVCERLERWTEVSLSACLDAVARRSADHGRRGDRAAQNAARQ